MIDEITYRLGEPGTLGWPVLQPDGTPMRLDDLELRVRIFLPDAILTLPARAEAGEFIVDGETVEYPAVMAIDIAPADIVAPRGDYAGVRQVNDGTGWRALPGGDFKLHVREW